MEIIFRTMKRERSFTFEKNYISVSKRNRSIDLRIQEKRQEKKKEWEQKYPQLSKFDEFVKFFGNFITPENFYRQFAGWDITGLRKIEGEGSHIYGFYTLLAPNAIIKKYDSVGCEYMSNFFKWQRLKKFVEGQKCPTYPLKEGFVWLQKGRERKIFHIAANGFFREFHGRVPCNADRHSRI